MSDVPYYTTEERATLLRLARLALERITRGESLLQVTPGTLPPKLREERACFVTLHRRADGALRGCTGTLVARRPLAEEVIYITEQTAFHDPRFPPVSAAEVDGLRIEISVLTPPQPLGFKGPEDLLRKLRPGVDGVTLQLGYRRATFLPQVWEGYPDPVVFLSLLAQKMGASPDAWRDPHVQVYTYQAEVFQEE